MSISSFLLSTARLLLLLNIITQHSVSFATEEKQLHESKQNHEVGKFLIPGQRQTSAGWSELLAGIKDLMLHKRGIKQPRAFISYAWEDTSTEEGKIENSKLQRYLEKLRDDLQSTGVSVFLDIGDMHGNMKKRMEENLKASDIIITINTPRFRARALAEPQTNLGFEYQLTLERAKEIPYGIFPLHYKGSFDEAFGGWGDDKELKELKGYLIRDCRNPENYKSSLVATQRPLGIIPAIYNIDCDEDKEYRHLLQKWRWSEFSMLSLPNRDFVGREEFLNKIDANLKDNRIQTISGMGGIGKSEVAVAYAYHHINEYDAVRIINAEGSNIRPEFERMAELFGIDSKGMSDKELASGIYEKINDYKWLLIFENAENYDSIKNYLPKQTHDHQHIIITSRSQHWKHCLVLGYFTETEVIQYVQHTLPAITKAEALKLGSLVGYLPLALTQAMSYIKGTGIGVNAYIKIYKKRGIAFIQNHKSAGEDQHYDVSLLKTITINMDKLKTKSPEALKMLLICSYLKHNNIPIKLFKHERLLKGLEEAYEALSELKNYSLVEGAKIQGYIQIHKLVQLVVRNEYEQQEGIDKVLLLLEEIGGALIKECPVEKLTGSDFEKARLLLPHMQSILKKIELYGKANVKHSDSLKLLAIRLSNSIAKALMDFGDYERAESMLRKSLVGIEAYYGTGHVEAGIILTMLGDTLRKLRRYEEAKELYNKALDINKKHFGEEHFEVARVLLSLSYIDEELGDKKLAIQEAVEAYRIMEAEKHHTVDLYAARIKELEESMESSIARVWRKYIVRPIKKLWACSGLLN